MSMMPEPERRPKIDPLMFRPNFILLFLCRGILIILPVGFTIFQILIALGMPPGDYALMLGILLSYGCLTLYDSLYKDWILYLENEKNKKSRNGSAS
jgi:hypothetical protein